MTQKAEWLITQNPKTPCFYTKPNIHKEGIPWRLVISSLNCHNSKILEYVEYHLQPIFQEILSYVKDKSDFLRHLKPIAEVPENSYHTTQASHSVDWGIPPPPKLTVRFFSWIFHSFSSLITFYLLKVTKFLIKIS